MTNGKTNMVVKTSIVLLFLCALLVDARPRPKKLDCRIYVYAAECRGAAAKRDTRRFEENSEERRIIQEMADEAELEHRKANQELLHSLLKKISSSVIDYDTGTDNFIH